MIDTGTTAILLAGGKGSRMNYQDKAWLNYAGKPLLEHVIRHIEKDVDHILISRNTPSPADKKLRYNVIRDDMHGFQGPLAGISSCTSHIKTDKTIVLPCDTPILPKNLASRLINGLSEFDIAVASSEGIIQPLIFSAKTKALNSIQPYLESGKRSAKGWLSSACFAEIKFGTKQFENINEVSQLV